MTAIELFAAIAFVVLAATAALAMLFPMGDDHDDFPPLPYI